MSSTAASLIHPSVIKAVSISLKPAPRERVRRASPFSVRSIISATDTGHLPAPGATDARGKVVIGIAALPDTDTHASRRGKLVRVAVNANANALVREHEAGRLTAEAYFAGVIYQELLERSHGMTKPSRGEWLMPMGGNKVNGQAHALVKKLEHAEFAASCFRDTARIIGMTGGRILELCLIGTGDGDGPKTFSQVAEIMGVTLRAQSETDASYLKRCKNDGMKIGWAFRDALNLLASGWELGGAPALPKRWGK